MRENRRRTGVVVNCPDGKSTLMLVDARFGHILGTRWGITRYLNMKRLRQKEMGVQAVQKVRKILDTTELQNVRTASRFLWGRCWF